MAPPTSPASPLRPRERIASAIRAAASRGGEPALVAYLTAGFPTRARFAQDVQALARGADVIEVGVPFTDPMADGVTIQRSSQVALAQGVTLRWILAELAALPRLGVPVLLMSYLNPLLAFGLDALPGAAARAGVSGFIVPDLPFDESSTLHAALAEAGLALVQMVTPVTRPERLAELCAVSEGFVYAVTMTGTTGKTVSIPRETLDYLARVRARARVPVCAGFGIRSAAHIARLKGHVDGVIVGSALVEVLERGEDPAAWLAALRGGGG
ncbi:MAG TPA: tryptophan synthase subunit alpha [Steroidobacteraceae bacterium]|nr:tryptophan synthase subunit alpha [Steroidobacteraceae bacterium]